MDPSFTTSLSYKSYTYKIVLKVFIKVIKKII